MATFEPSPIAFSLGRLDVHWYGLIMAVALFVGYLIVSRLAKRQGMNRKLVGDTIFYAIIVGLLSARLYHVLGNVPYYVNNPDQILAIWNGGQAIHGALIGGLLVVLFFTKRKKLPFWKFADISSLALILGQALGRWGNYFNQELYGGPTNLPWKLLISPENRLAGYETVVWYHPAFLYESILNLILFVVLYRLFIKQRVTDGSIFLLYIIGYSVIRFVMEFIRIDPVLTFFDWLRWPQVVSILLITGAFVLLFRRQNYTV